MQYPIAEKLLKPEQVIAVNEFPQQQLLEPSRTITFMTIQAPWQRIVESCAHNNDEPKLRVTSC